MHHNIFLASYFSSRRVLIKDQKVCPRPHQGFFARPEESSSYTGRTVFALESVVRRTRTHFDRLMNVAYAYDIPVSHAIMPFPTFLLGALRLLLPAPLVARPLVVGEDSHFVSFAPSHALHCMPPASAALTLPGGFLRRYPRIF